MSTDNAAIEKFFEEAEYRFTKLDEGVWKTGFRGRLRDFTILARLAESWLLMQVAVIRSPEPECRSRLYEHLLRMNFHMNMAKFGIDSDGDVMLMVELPTANLDFAEFQAGFMALLAYAEGSFLEVANLATDPNATSSLEVKEKSTAIPQEFSQPPSTPDQNGPNHKPDV